MDNYLNYSEYYDEQGNNNPNISDKILKFIQDAGVKGNKLLDVACGTGTTLKYFYEKKYEVMGIDISGSMLALAKKKLPSVVLLKMNMTKLDFDQTFDVITCLFDSVNHLLDINDWDKFFRLSYKYLNSSGVLIFDMNTIEKLVKLSQVNPICKTYEDKSIIMAVTSLSGGIFNWSIKISKNNLDGTIEDIEENIKETSFSVKNVNNFLSKIFSEISISDEKGLDPNEKSNRVYFVCKK